MTGKTWKFFFAALFLAFFLAPQGALAQDKPSGMRLKNPHLRKELDFAQNGISFSPKSHFRLNRKNLTVYHVPCIYGKTSPTRQNDEFAIADFTYFFGFFSSSIMTSLNATRRSS